MEIIVRWAEPPRRCDYDPGHTCVVDYMCVAALDPTEYMAQLLAGWRRFGYTIFRQQCSGPHACRSMRVDTASFRPDRSQRRAKNANQGIVDLRIGTPTVTSEKVALFDRFHADRAQTKGWRSHEPDDADEYARSFVSSPFPMEEWCYYLGDVLVGVGYVDILAGGLSAIYFAHDPDYRDRSLGTWNVLSLLDRALALDLPHVYLGYVTQACASLRYKARFRPNQCLEPDGKWRDEAF
jgi:arginyl-tRNA--protein-N-Asp/Glu arginylyltransferase